MNCARLRLLVFLSLALVVVPFAAAEVIRFDPPNATANHSVDATVSGIWLDGCTPTVKSVAVSGQTVTLHLDNNVPIDIGCVLSTVQYSRTFHLGVLPAGRYTVIAIADQGSTSTELARAPLIVRDSETLTISPYAIPTSGGPIGLANPFFLAGATVTIGGFTVAANSDVDGSLFVNAPPHAAGVVDVVVNAANGTVMSKAALIYYDPSAADPAVFEPILFPLSFQGAGAFGSQWVTENFLYANSSAAYFRDPLPCAGCSASIDIGMKQLANNGNPWGHLLYAMRGTTGSVDFASRIRDTSRQSSTAGTEIPVVRERDFRGQLRFLNVPVESRYRVMLRLWSLGDFPQFIVNVDSLALDVAPLSVTRIPATAMWFDSIDVTSLVSKGRTNPTSVLVYPSGYGSPYGSLPFPPIWGMLSITNNDTQQVTIVTPQ
jgi:hypothetical protein